MAGGNFAGRVISYLVNEVLVESLANNPTFQRFAVRTSRTIEQVTSKVEQAKQEFTEQIKDVGKNHDSFGRR